MQLLGESLDALPVNVSLLDPEGTILQTNQSWQEFGSQNGIQTAPDTAGVNYLEVCGRSETDTATAARRGLAELLAGKRHQFQLEYPCHSPVEQRWFLLVAVPVEIDEKRHAVVAHINITDQKRRERELERQVDRLEALTDLTTAVREITHTVIDQSMRSEIERAVCDELVLNDGYDCARIGEVDGRTGGLTVRASAGDCGSIQEPTESDELFGATVIREAVWTGQLQTTTRRTENTAFDWRQDTPPVATKRAVAAVPIRHAETLYSVLTIHTDRADAFGSDERTILTELGEVVGHAIAASERTQALMSHELIEVELRLPDLFPTELPSATDWTVEITQTVAGPNDDYTMYGTTTEDDIETVTAVVDSLDDVELTVIGGSGETIRVAFDLSRQCVIPLLASHGWSTESAVLANGDCYLTVHLPSGDNVREMVETVSEVFPNTELLARRQIHAKPQVDSEIQKSALAELTDRQRTVLQTAYAAGYFNWPRDATGAEVAESLGIAPPTFHQHLRVGQQKLIDTIFGELPVAI
jgi:predicted DNA binding protein